MGLLRFSVNLSVTVIAHSHPNSRSSSVLHRSSSCTMQDASILFIHAAECGGPFTTALETAVLGYVRVKNLNSLIQNPFSGSFNHIAASPCYRLTEVATGSQMSASARVYLSGRRFWYRVVCLC